MAFQLSLRPKNPKSLANPSLIHLFSSNSSGPSDPNDDTADSPSTAPTGSSQSPGSSYFSDIKARLRQQQQQSSSRPNARNPSYPFTSPPNRSSSQTSKAASLEEIRKNLSEFRSRSSVPPPFEPSSTPSSSSQRGVSFQELYQRNAMGKGEGGNAASDSLKGGRDGKLSFEAIRESLRKLKLSGGMQNERKGVDSMSLSAFKNSLKLKPSDSTAAPSSTMVLGGTDRLPASVFGKEMRDRRDGESEGMKTEFVKMYSHGELGSKLRALRSDNAKKEQNWFSLTELNERLMKLREMEEKETESRIGGVAFKDLRESLVRLKMSEDEKSKKKTIQRLDILGLGRTPNYMQQPPKEHLAEKFFHPDNMSSAEKLKIELTKVREEFKMSESDCGSARVQVAQLTTKIKHLSSVLHKKDKHSKKGLLEMVQLRKKLLKYLRRTDWDSYCLVLSKFGLRDNPDYKN